MTITYEDTKVDFKGDSQTVLSSINEFLLKAIPQLELAKKISKNYSLEDILSKFSHLIKITPEGPRIWANSQKISDREKIGLQLLAYHVAYLAEKLHSPSVSINDLNQLTGLNPKSISSRLSELQKLSYISKENINRKIKFKITTQGINWLETGISNRL